MPVKKGEQKPQYTYEEKKEFVERVCELYETQNATLKSCCDAAGISNQAFALWVGKFGEFGERYKKAKKIQDDNFWEEIVKPKSKTSLERLLEGEETEDIEYKELTFQGMLSKDPETDKVQVAKTIKRSKTQPNPTSVIFALKTVFPEKTVDRTESNVNVTSDDWFTKLPLEKRLAILKIANDTDG